MSSPTQRTLATVRKSGWQACVVEKWVPQARRRVDAFGFGDLLAVHPTLRQIKLIQACARCDVSKRLTKIRTERREAASAWLDAGGVIEIWGWPGPRIVRVVLKLTLDEVLNDLPFDAR